METLKDEKMDWMPLYLSTIAGLSTCIGAAVVFCLPKAENNGVVEISPDIMCYSLSLAGSVMITVSVISILPECLKSSAVGDDGEHTLILWNSWEMVSRVICFSVGVGSYYVLAKCAFPEPEDLIAETVAKVTAAASRDAEKTRPEEEMVDFLPNASDDDKKASHVEPKGIEMMMQPRTDDTSRTMIRRSNSDEVRKYCGSPAASPKSKLTIQTSDAEEGVIDTNETKQSTKSTIPFSSMLKSFTSGSDLNPTSRRAWRVAILLFFSLLVHNFPEGLAVAASTVQSPHLGVTVTIGIMIHNIPEGIAIAIPCLAARPDWPWLAFIMASVSGLAEPMGAFVTLLWLRNIDEEGSANNWNIISLEDVLALVAGIMIMVSCWELFPEARRHILYQKKVTPLSPTSNNTGDNFNSTKKDYRAFLSGIISGVVLMVATELYI